MGQNKRCSVIFLCENAWSISLCGERDNASWCVQLLFWGDYSNAYWRVMAESTVLWLEWTQQPRKSEFLFKTERESAPVWWITATYRTKNLSDTTKWQKCHLLVNEIQKNFILIDIFSRISVFLLKDKKAKTNRVSFVASSGKAKGATSVSAQL